jgi:hypothetical protein
MLRSSRLLIPLPKGRFLNSGKYLLDLLLSIARGIALARLSDLGNAAA